MARCMTLYIYYLEVFVIKAAAIYNIHSRFIQWHIWPNMQVVHTLFLTVYGAVLQQEMEGCHLWHNSSLYMVQCYSRKWRDATYDIIPHCIMVQCYSRKWRDATYDIIQHLLALQCIKDKCIIPFTLENMNTVFLLFHSSVRCCNIFPGMLSFVLYMPVWTNILGSVKGWYAGVAIILIGVSHTLISLITDITVNILTVSKPFSISNIKWCISVFVFSIFYTVNVLESPLFCSSSLSFSNLQLLLITSALNGEHSYPLCV